MHLLGSFDRPRWAAHSAISPAMSLRWTAAAWAVGARDGMRWPTWPASTDGDTLLSQVVRRLRCQECGGKAVSVVLLHPIGLRKPVTVRVPLKGPEAKD